MCTSKDCMHVYGVVLTYVPMHHTTVYCPLYALYRHVLVVVTTEQSSVPATESPSEGRPIHGSFTIVSAWVALVVIYRMSARLGVTLCVWMGRGSGRRKACYDACVCICCIYMCVRDDFRKLCKGDIYIPCKKVEQ